MTDTAVTIGIHEGVDSWQAHLNPALFSRLTRPLREPCVLLRTDLVRRIVRTIEDLHARSALSGQILKRRKVNPGQPGKSVPIVDAQWVQLRSSTWIVTPLPASVPPTQHAMPGAAALQAEIRTVLKAQSSISPAHPANTRQYLVAAATPDPTTMSGSGHGGLPARSAPRDQRPADATAVQVAVPRHAVDPVVAQLTLQVPSEKPHASERPEEARRQPRVQPSARGSVESEQLLLQVEQSNAPLTTTTAARPERSAPEGSASTPPAMLGTPNGRSEDAALMVSSAPEYALTVVEEASLADLGAHGWQDVVSAADQGQRRPRVVNEGVLAEAQQFAHPVATESLAGSVRVRSANLRPRTLHEPNPDGMVHDSAQPLAQARITQDASSSAQENRQVVALGADERQTTADRSAIEHDTRGSSVDSGDVQAGGEAAAAPVRVRSANLRPWTKLEPNGHAALSPAAPSSGAGPLSVEGSSRLVSDRMHAIEQARITQHAGSSSQTHDSGSRSRIQVDEVSLITTTTGSSVRSRSQTDVSSGSPIVLRTVTRRGERGVITESLSPQEPASQVASLSSAQAGLRRMADAGPMLGHRSERSAHSATTPGTVSAILAQNPPSVDAAAPGLHPPEGAEATASDGSQTSRTRLRVRAIHPPAKLIEQMAASRAAILTSERPRPGLNGTAGMPPIVHGARWTEKGESTLASSTNPTAGPIASMTAVVPTSSTEKAPEVASTVESSPAVIAGTVERQMDELVAKVQRRILRQLAEERVRKGLLR